MGDPITRPNGRPNVSPDVSPNVSGGGTETPDASNTPQTSPPRPEPTLGTAGLQVVDGVAEARPRLTGTKIPAAGTRAPEAPSDSRGIGARTVRQGPGGDLESTFKTLADPMRRGGARRAQQRVLRAMGEDPTVADNLIHWMLHGGEHSRNFWTKELDATYDAGVEGGLITPRQQSLYETSKLVKRLSSLSDDVEQRGKEGLAEHLSSPDPTIADLTAAMLENAVRGHGDAAFDALKVLEASDTPSALAAIARLASDARFGYAVGRELRSAGEAGIQAAIDAWPSLDAEHRGQLWDILDRPEVWGSAVDSAKSGDHSRLNALLRSAADQPRHIGSGILATLRADASEPAIDALRRLTTDPESGRMAFFALRDVGAPAARQLASQWEDLSVAERSEFLPILGAHSTEPEVAETLLRSINGTNPELQAHTTEWLKSAVSTGQSSNLSLEQRQAFVRALLEHAPTLPEAQRAGLGETLPRLLDGSDSATLRGFYVAMQQAADNHPQHQALFNKAARDTADILARAPDAPPGQRINPGRTEDLDTALAQQDWSSAALLLGQATPQELDLVCGRYCSYGDDTPSQLASIVQKIREDSGAVRAGHYTQLLGSMFERRGEDLASAVLRQELGTSEGQQAFLRDHLSDVISSERLDLLDAVEPDAFWAAMGDHLHRGQNLRVSTLLSPLASGVMDDRLGRDVGTVFGSDAFRTLPGEQQADVLKRVLDGRESASVFENLKGVLSDSTFSKLSHRNLGVILEATADDPQAHQRFKRLARNKEFKRASNTAQAAIFRRLADNASAESFDHIHRLLGSSVFKGLSAGAKEAYIEAKASPWVRVIRANFAAWDRNGNGYLSESDVLRAFQDPTVRGRDAAAVAILKKHLEELEEFSNDEFGDENDGLTLQDLLVFENTRESDYPLGYYEGKIRRQSRDLFPNGNPDGHAVRQGSHGDCWLLGTIAALAEQRPQDIRNMIRRRGANYEVTLRGRRYTVPPPTDAEIALYANAGSDGLWLTVLEKAFAQYANAQNWIPYSDDFEETEGDFGSRAILGLTGHGSDDDSLYWTSLSTTRTKLQRAFRNNHIVVASISGSNKKAKNDYDLPTGHLYSVLGYDRATDTVTLRNPWGRGEPEDDQGRARDGNDDGVFQLSLREFDAVFNRVTYEDP